MKGNSDDRLIIRNQWVNYPRATRPRRPFANLPKAGNSLLQAAALLGAIMQVVD